MPKKIVTWSCEVCKEAFDSEQECLAHEAIHSKEIPCVHISSRGGENECTCTIRLDGNIANLAFTWKRGQRQVTNRFKFTDVAIKSINVPDVAGPIEQPIEEQGT